MKICKQFSWTQTTFREELEIVRKTTEKGLKKLLRKEHNKDLFYSSDHTGQRMKSKTLLADFSLM